VQRPAATPATSGSAIGSTAAGAPGAAVGTLQGSNLVRAGFRCRKGDGGDRKRALAAAERTPAGRHSSPDPTCRALSVIGRFNSLIVGFISLFGRFICLFGRVGNLHSGVSQYQYLTVQGGSSDRPGIGFFAVFCRRPGTPIPAGLLRHQGCGSRFADRRRRTRARILACHGP